MISRLAFFRGQVRSHGTERSTERDMRRVWRAYEVRGARRRRSGWKNRIYSVRRGKIFWDSRHIRNRPFQQILSGGNGHIHARMHLHILGIEVVGVLLSLSGQYSCCIYIYERCVVTALIWRQIRELKRCCCRDRSLASKRIE